MVPLVVLLAAYDHIEPPSHLFVEDILNPQWHPHDIRWNYKPPYAVVNIVEEPRRAFPIFVSFFKSYVFRGGEPRTILDTNGIEYIIEESNVDEWEYAMEFFTGTTRFSDRSISEYQRRMLLGQMMDLNCLTWILAIAVVDQNRLKTTILDMPFYCEIRAVLQGLPHFGMDFEVARGEGQQSIHLWKWWGIEKSQGHLAESLDDYETLKEYVEKLFFNGDAKTSDRIYFLLKRKELLGMSG